MARFRVSAKSDKLRGMLGMSLPIVLMFLLVISLLATVGMRRATLGESLSRNQIELETARQAAEAALRDAERDLLLPTGAMRANALCGRGADRPTDQNLDDTYFNTACPRGQCFFGTTYYTTSNYNASPVVNPQPWWPTTNSKGGLWNNDSANKPSDSNGVGTNCTFNGAVPLGTFTGTPRLAAVAAQPEYIIERMKRGTDTFMRITARGFGTDPNTEFVMQSIFKPYTE
jgi:type IV pilus assembly protein PilX